MKFKIVSTNTVIVEAKSLDDAQALAKTFRGNVTLTRIEERVYVGDIIENLGNKYMLVKVWISPSWEGHFDLINIREFTQYSNKLLKSKNGEQWITMDDIEETYLGMQNPKLTGKNMKDCINYGE
jgi:hypothetical protein